MVSAREIQAVAELLQISPEGLQKAITFKVTVSSAHSASYGYTSSRHQIDLCSAPSFGGPSVLSINPPWVGP